MPSCVVKWCRNHTDMKNAGITFHSVMPVYDTIIVGMGAAGCTAASVLCQAGRRVLALEAMDRVGGRVNTVPFGNGIVELGAEWIHGQHNSRVYELAVQNNVSIIPQDVSFQVFRSDGTTLDKDLINDLMNFTLEAVDDPPKDPEPLGQYLTRRLMDYIATDHPDLLEDKDLIEQFLNFMDLVIDNYEGSNSWNDVTTHTKYEDLEGDLHMSWHSHGYHTLFDILLNTYKGGPGYRTLNIQLEKVVTKISYPQDPAQDVEVRCKDGSVYKARNVIVTVSLGVLKERHNTLFSPQLPTDKIEMINAVSMAYQGKIVLNFDQIWWDPDIVNNEFLWLGEDRKEVPYEDRWFFKVEGLGQVMSLNTSVSLWTTGDATIMQILECTEELQYNERQSLVYTTLFYPPLPDEKAATIDTLSIGVVDKIVLLFDYVWWSKNLTVYGFVWRAEERAQISEEDSWVKSIFGASSPMGSEKALTLWTSGRMAKMIETLPEDVVKRKAMELIRRFMGKGKIIPEPIDMLRSTWYSNPYTRGSYTFDNLQTPRHPTARDILAAPLTDSGGAPRVLFAGEATHSAHFSTVHGAVDTGHREAMRLLPKGKL